MSTLMGRVDAMRCPLCGAANLCAVESARHSGTPQPECWCMQADFSLAPLAAVSEAVRGQACLCAACAAGGAQTREKNPLS